MLASIDVSDPSVSVERVRDPKRLARLGPARLLLGRFEAAELALAEALQLGIKDEEERLSALCWRSASSRAAGHSESADASHGQAVAIARTRQEARQREQARARQIAAEQQRALEQWQAQERLNTSPEGDAWADSGTSLGALQRALAIGSSSSTAPRRASDAVVQEYYAAKAAYDGETSRYEAERKMAHQRAGRLGALGIQINPRPVDEAVHRRYLAAERAYEAQGG